MGLALGIALKFYTRVAKGLKLKVKKFWELIPTFAEVTREKPIAGAGGGGAGDGGGLILMYQLFVDKQICFENHHQQNVFTKK